MNFLMGRIRRARAAYELGRKLQAAIERGRKLHPWQGMGAQVVDLAEEISELSAEVWKWDNGNGSIERIKSEAIDCAVVALRIVERK